MNVEKASKIIRRHYGSENVLQVRRPHGKRFFIADLLHGTFNFTEKDILQIFYSSSRLKSKNS